MKKKLWSLASCVGVLALGSSAAFAECAASQCTGVFVQQIWSDAGTSSDGDIWFQTTGAESALNCTSVGNVWLKLPTTATARAEIYSLIMMAFAIDKPVSLGIVPGSSQCIVAFAFVDRSS